MSNETAETSPRFMSLSHLLLSSIQGLLDPFGEDPGPSLEVRTRFVLCHVSPFGFSGFTLSERTSPFRVLPLENLRLQLKAAEVEQQRECQDAGDTHWLTERDRRWAHIVVRCACSNLLTDFFFRAAPVVEASAAGELSPAPRLQSAKCGSDSPAKRARL